MTPRRWAVRVTFGFFMAFAVFWILTLTEMVVAPGPYTLPKLALDTFGLALNGILAWHFERTS